MTADLFDSQVGSKKGRLKASCYETHPTLKFGKGTLVGASCISPRDGYDIYIGFDYSMRFDHSAYPWESSSDPVIEFKYRISDMSVPKSPKDFKKMITWVCSQLKKGKKIHVGCIGGHGRTGLFIAAVRAEFYGDLNAGNWVRKNHCKKAIETKAQINFLFKHYGIKKIKYSKASYKGWVDKSNKHSKGKGNSVVPFKKGTQYPEKITYIYDGKGSIWG